MLTRRLWPYVRRFVPVSWYPALGFFHRLDEACTARWRARDDRRYLAEHGLDDVPPLRMRYRVIGEVDVRRYVASSDESRRCLTAGLAQAGKTFDDFQSVLDFGCGCGRTLRAFRNRPAFWRMFAVDVDAQALAWCRTHFDFVSFSQTSEHPPLPFADDQFDLGWAISVFTHLDEERQFAWLAELKRIIRPGGIFLTTTHGKYFWQGLRAESVRDVENRGILFARTGVDRGLLPDWYQATWHTREYVEREWGRFFEIVAYLPEGSTNRQDLVVLRRV